MDEADVETHGIRRKNVPGDDPVWTEAVCDRMERMVLRDRNHPSIVIWSLGNEAGEGSSFVEMRKRAEIHDRTRPFHYEGDHRPGVSDFVSRMYPSVELTEKMGKKELHSPGAIQKLRNQYLEDDKEITAAHYEGRPIILCEYAHAMENSVGNLDEYMALFKKYPNMTGGFIWDFVDQSIGKRQPDGSVHWLYGGDFGEEKTNGCFCANGLIAADRTPHPSLFEVSYQYSDIRIDVEFGEETLVWITNERRFRDLGDCDFLWERCLEGVVVEHGTLDVGALAPLSRMEIKLPSGSGTSGEEVLTVRARLKWDTPWAKAGHEIGWGQGVRKGQSGSGIIGGSKRPEGMTIQPSFDGAGNLWGLRGAGSPLEEPLTGALIPSFWRPQTDNDRNFHNFFPVLERILPSIPYKKGWESAKETGHLVELEADGQVVGWITEKKLKGFREPVKITYKKETDGSLLVNMLAIPTREIQRAGFTLSLDGAYEHVRYYGRGPWENYADRKQGALLGLYESKAGDLGHNYMRPQENGLRTEVRWFELVNESGRGLRFEMVDEPLSFSVWPYGPDELEKATHIHKLEPSGQWTVNIDGKHCGVGGDFPGIANLHPPYKLTGDKPYKVVFRIRMI